jgi:ATP-dependent DNA helicase RecG
MDALVLVERVRNAIALHESHFREFKSAYTGPPGDKRPRRWAEVARDIAEALVAFANADGGDLLVGVEDDGNITGVPHSPDEIANMLKATETHVKGQPLPIQIATELFIDDARVLFFSVLKGSTGVFQLSDGRCVRRDGTRTVPEVAERILFDQRETRGRAYDSENVDGAAVGDLDLALLSGIADRYLRGITPEKFLQQLGLAEFVSGGLRLRRAALLLFASDIARWHPRCQVRILKVEGNSLRSGAEYNVTSDEATTGNVFDLLVRAWEALRPYLAYKTELGPDAAFQERYIYPEWACREALVNALTHRDYSLSLGVDVFIYDDRMEFRSPGALLSTLTIEQLLRLAGSHESRNPLVARVLREAGYVRELGEGMKRIFKLMEDSALATPTLASDEGSFTVTLYHRSVFSPPQMTWLEMFRDLGLSTLEQRVVVAGMAGRELSPRDTYRAMHTDDRDTYDRVVTALRTKGALHETRTNPQATALARQTRKAKTEIGRFVVAPPGSVPDTALPAKTSTKNAPNDRLKLAVFGIPEGVSENDLGRVFADFGSIADVRIPPQGESRQRYGFVTLVGVRDRLELLGAVFSVRGVQLRVEAARDK